MDHGAQCICPACAVQIPFDLPEEILDACQRRELVIFAGAGISTENPLVLPFTLADDIAIELGYERPTDVPDFPQLMEQFEDKFGRRKLLEEIHRRLSKIRSFPELDRKASAFHRELSALFPITEIFTTNWDTYFEQECGAQPFVTPKDWAFWRSAKRRVFKLHGSIGNPASLVVTARDYRRCHRALSSGVLGAHLRSILATKTVLFVGYSFRDPDFSAIYRLLIKQMGDILPRSYIITPSDAEPPTYLKKSEVIRTDATFFLRTLREQMPSYEFVDEERLRSAPYMADIATMGHEKMLDECPLEEYPVAVFAASYQDGFIHAFEHITANFKEGNYWHRCYVEDYVRLYDGFAADRRRERRYFETAYLEGYRNGLKWLLQKEGDDKPPLFFLFGLRNSEQPKTLDEFKTLAKHPSGLHKTATKQAVRLAEFYASSGTVPHHIPMMAPPG
jgi:hypothetical protein